jgi:hypothetical protein
MAAAALRTSSRVTGIAGAVLKVSRTLIHTVRSGQQKTRRSGFFVSAQCGSRILNVRGSRALRTRGHVEADLLAFLERLEALHDTL